MGFVVVMAHHLGPWWWPGSEGDDLGLFFLGVVIQDGDIF